MLEGKEDVIQHFGYIIFILVYSCLHLVWHFRPCVHFPKVPIQRALDIVMSYMEYEICEAIFKSQLQIKLTINLGTVWHEGIKDTTL